MRDLAARHLFGVEMASAFSLDPTTTIERDFETPPTAPSMNDDIVEAPDCCDEPASRDNKTWLSFTRKRDSGCHAQADAK